MADAAKLFVNWILTKEGQSILYKNINFNSARIDVETFDQVGAPAAGKKYYFTGRESTYAKQEEPQKFLATMPNIG